MKNSITSNRKKMMQKTICMLTCILISLLSVDVNAVVEPPNVILIMTDDLGYGDISAHGSPVLKTPELDTLREQSVRFTDFHVAPKCTPTRGQLMTGIDAMRNGATRVCQGRSLPQPHLKMMPQYFADAGYATGMFGKWHLGDSYPYQPRFRGFQEVVSFRAWGITSLADYWGNDYFDPVLMHNGVDKKYEGYCTDIFFREAMNWIEHCAHKEKPFFVYLPTNTPHVPEQVANEYSQPYAGKYKGKPIPGDFYGMIANIDENIGKLERFLKEKGLRDNTMLIFLSDNGTQNNDAMQLFNAGMRAKKGSVFDGGHRVPLFVRWVDGKLKHGTDISELTTVQDLLPTLMDLCALGGDRSAFNGTSLAGLLKGTTDAVPERMVVAQLGYTCDKWDQAVVMHDTWRLLKEKRKKGLALYNIADDPHQDKNVFDRFPDVAKSMSALYDQWYAQARPLFDRERYITIGSNKANPLTLYANDWQGDYCDNPRGLIAGKAKGYWDLIVDRDGAYDIELRRWPEESGKALNGSYDGKSVEGAIPVDQARLQVGDFNQTVDTKPRDTMVRFSVNLKQGKTKLCANLLDGKSAVICGAMYVKVTRKENTI
jgi:arylsulfatase A-like enzyme